MKRIISAFAFAVSLASCSDAPGCEQRKVLGQAVSPDGAWTATVYYNICTLGPFVTVVSDTVEVLRPNEKPTPVPSPATVFGMDDRYDESKPISATWIGLRNLEITIPNDAWAGKQDSAFADVAISYRYVPDDPVERACLKQWRSLPTEEMVRRNLSSTENIKSFLLKCKAGSAAR
jgi:hypothetical protein